MQRRYSKKSKRKCQDMHAKKRAYQRFGIYLNTESIVNEIQQNKLQFIEKQSNRVTVLRKVDKLEELDIIIVYDKIRKQIITVMPYNMYFKSSQQGEINVKEKDQETKGEEPREEIERTNPEWKEHWLNGQ